MVVMAMEKKRHRGAISIAELTQEHLATICTRDYEGNKRFPTSVRCPANEWAAIPYWAVLLRAVRGRQVFYQAVTPDSRRELIEFKDGRLGVFPRRALDVIGLEERTSVEIGGKAYSVIPEAATQSMIPMHAFRNSMRYDPPRYR